MKRNTLLLRAQLAARGWRKAFYKERQRGSPCVRVMQQVMNYSDEGAAYEKLLEENTALKEERITLKLRVLDLLEFKASVTKA